MSFFKEYLDIWFFFLQLHIDSHHEPTSPSTKEEVDFFKEHVDIIESNPLSDSQKLFSVSEPQPIKNGNLKKEEFGRIMSTPQPIRIFVIYSIAIEKIFDKNSNPSRGRPPPPRNKKSDSG